MPLKTKQHMVVVPFDPTCAWCLESHGLLTRENQHEGDSHGICTPHAEQEELKYQTNRFNRVKSFVERFRDGRERF